MSKTPFEAVFPSFRTDETPTQNKGQLSLWNLPTPYVVPPEERVYPVPTNFIRETLSVDDRYRSRFIRPFLPETVIALINLDVARLTAEQLYGVGYVMLRGVGVSPEEAMMTVGQLAFLELARNRNPETLETEFEQGARVGPFSLGKWGVSAGVGLWIPAPKS